MNKQNSAWRCCYRKVIPQEFLFRKKIKIHPKKPDNPSNINWENLEKTKMNICYKIIISFIVILLVLILTLLINLLIQSFNTNYKLKQSSTSYDCTKNISDEVYEEFYKEYQDIIDKDSSERTNKEIEVLEAAEYLSKTTCYCNQFDFIELVKEQSTKFKYCKNLVLAEVKTFSISIATGIVISIINFILVFIISRLVMWIPFKSLTAQITVQIGYIFIALFINTFVSGWIINRLFCLCYIVKRLMSSFNGLISGISLGLLFMRILIGNGSGMWALRSFSQ